MRMQRFKINRKLRQAIKALPCTVCGSRRDVDPCHIRTFGSSGIETEWNIIPMCRAHHDEQHYIGWKRFCDKYQRAAAKLRELGWRFVEVNGFWKLHNEKELKQ